MRHFASSIRAAVLGVAIAAATPAFVLPAAAQEQTPEHIALAVEVVKAAGATRGFDRVLPQLASQVINRLIALRPDLHKEIAAAAEAAAVKLAVRRSELDTDIGRIWAQNFTEPELQSLLAFYTSDAGKKFSEIGPRMVSQSYAAVDRWSARVGSELLEKTREELKNQGIEIGN